MTEKRSMLSDVQQALLKCAHNCPIFDVGSTWQELVHEVSSLEGKRRYRDWPTFVPEEIRSVWPKLSLVTRIVAYCLAAKMRESVV